MQWNWPQKDSPNFTYHDSEIDALENQLIKQFFTTFGAFKHLNEDDKNYS